MNPIIFFLIIIPSIILLNGSPWYSGRLSTIQK